MTARKEQDNVALEIDLSGVECPINYAKIKVKMAKMKPGEVLKAILDPGEPVRSVPISLDMDGHRVISIEKMANGQFTLFVQKRKQV